MALVLAVVTVRQPLLALGVVVAVAGAVVLFRLPERLLPGIALVAFAVLPLGYMPVWFLYKVVTPSLVVAVIWIIRVHGSGIRSRRVSPAWAVLSVLFGAWLLVRTVDSISVKFSVAWSLCCVVLLIGMATAAYQAGPGTRDSLLRTWMLLGIALAIFAILESVAKHNPIENIYGSRTEIGLAQHWSVYRATTTLGHPLMNATFFAMTAAIALAIALQRRSWMAVWCCGLCVAAVACTVSRGGIAAVAAGLVVVIFMPTRRARPGAMARRGALVAASIAALILVLNSSLVRERGQSQEAATSASGRLAVVHLSEDISRSDHFLGSGAGTSKIRNETVEPALVIESSPLELLVSLGAPGLVLFMALLLAVGVGAFRRRRVEAVAGLFAYCVMASSFNLAESNFGALILPGLLAILAFAPDETEPRAPVAAEPIAVAQLALQGSR